MRSKLFFLIQMRKQKHTVFYIDISDPHNGDLRNVGNMCYKTLLKLD